VGPVRCPAHKEKGANPVKETPLDTLSFTAEPMNRLVWGLTYSPKNSKLIILFLLFVFMFLTVINPLTFFFVPVKKKKEIEI